MHELLNISVAIFVGLMLTRLGNKFRLPDVTAYLVAGVLIGLLLWLWLRVCWWCGTGIVLYGAYCRYPPY